MVLKATVWEEIEEIGGLWEWNEGGGGGLHRNDAEPETTRLQLSMFHKQLHIVHRTCFPVPILWSLNTVHVNKNISKFSSYSTENTPRLHDKDWLVSTKYSKNELPLSFKGQSGITQFLRGCVIVSKWRRPLRHQYKCSNLYYKHARGPKIAIPRICSVRLPSQGTA
jgi:hypothetical protein